MFSILQVAIIIAECLKVYSKQIFTVQIKSISCAVLASKYEYSIHYVISTDGKKSSHVFDIDLCTLNKWKINIKIIF